MKKRLICCLIVLAMCLSLFVGCATKFDQDTLSVAIQNIETNLLKVTETPESYEVSNKAEDTYYDAKGNEATIYVKWKIENSNIITLEDKGDTTKVIVPTNRASKIPYTLRATLVNAKGKEYLNSNKEPYTAKVERIVPIASGNQGGTGGDNSGGDNSGGGNQGGDNQGGGNQGGTTPTTATLSLFGSATRTSYSESQIVHKDNGITYTNDKANSKNSCYNNQNADYATRAYEKSTIKIEYSSAMTAIVFTLDDGTYNNKQYMFGFDGMSVADASITRNNDTVTIVLSEPATSFKSAELASQCRIESVTVYTSGTPDVGGGTGGSGGDNTGGNTGGDTSGQAGTFDFNFVTNFGTYASSWKNQYGSQTVTSTDLGVSNANVSFVFSNASKQDGTITNMPVMASKAGADQYVTATAVGNTISSVTFNLTEWVTGGGGSAKTFTTLTIQYSTDGNNWTDTNVGLVNGAASQVSAYPTLTCSNLPSGVIAVRLVIVGNSSEKGNQQVGISGCTLVLA